MPRKKKDVPSSNVPSSNAPDSIFRAIIERQLLAEYFKEDEVKNILLAFYSLQFLYLSIQLSSYLCKYRQRRPRLERLSTRPRIMFVSASRLLRVEVRPKLVRLEARPRVLRV